MSLLDCAFEVGPETAPQLRLLLTITGLYHYVPFRATLLLLRHIRPSTAAPVLQFVIHWTPKRLLLPPVPLRLLFARQPAKPGQVLPAGANLD